ncbi:MAG: hypothetical protein LBK83_13370 [Treponema sp.]|jgi:hypothetical protein|nr:hypothetical protein [Treponema sp.]
MGLLSKAATKSSYSGTIDTMGEALKNRILRLPRSNSTVDTALNLLKAYGPFQAGFCFTLSAGEYVCYASSGAGKGKLRFPLRRIPENTGDYRRLEDNLNGTVPAGGRAWFFPLDRKNPCQNLFLCIEEGRLNPESLMLLLRELGEVLTPRQKASPGKKGGLLERGMKKRSMISTGEKRGALETVIRRSMEGENGVGGIILKDNKGKKNFPSAVSRAVSSLGNMFPLPDSTCLVLVPLNIDQELLAHRLSKSLDAKTVLRFEADSAGKVLEILKSFG